MITFGRLTFEVSPYPSPYYLSMCPVLLYWYEVSEQKARQLLSARYIGISFRRWYGT